MRTFWIIGLLLAWSFAVPGLQGAEHSGEVSATESTDHEAEFDVYRGAIPVRKYSFEHADDLDYDKQPDDWIRRQGVKFRQYVHAEIDYYHAAAGGRSLRFDANGSGVAYYSPPIPIDAAHSYVMEASVLTRGLTHDAAVVSFSFLNQRKQRVERVLTAPVSGTHREWQRLRIPPVTPPPGCVFVVIGCHLVHSDDMDLSGTAWFDEISISKLPFLSLASNFETHFRESNSDITIHAQATGLDDSLGDEQFRYELQLQVENVDGAILDQTTLLLHDAGAGGAKAAGSEIDSAAEDLSDPAPTLETPSRPLPERTVWKLPVYPPGFYRVKASLTRNAVTIIRQETSFAVLNRTGRAPQRGEFGWNLTGAGHQMQFSDLVAVARESGINWLKTPVWKNAYSRDPSQFGEFLSDLRNESIQTVGMLNDPPESIRRKFAANWTGISELFVAPPVVWREAANQVMALYSPSVTRWQLGDDHDPSFVGMSGFDRTLENIRQELQRIGQIRQLGVHWNLGSPVERNPSLNRNFLTILFDEHQSVDAVAASVAQIQSAGYEAWVVVKANEPGPNDDPFPRANQLVRRMVDAKRAGCDLVFAYDVFDSRCGLLRHDGAPSELFLPWRTTALALNASQYAGSIQLPGRSENHVFLRENDAVLVLWSDEPQEEEIYLGDEVLQQTVWGDRRRLTGDPRTGRQKFQVSSVPLILTGCSKQMMEWRMGVRFAKGRIASSMTEQEDTLLVKNAFDWPVQGTAQVLPENGWEVLPAVIPFAAQAQEELALPVEIKLPNQTNRGNQLMSIEFNLGGAGLSHPFQVFHDYQIGLGDVHMDVQLIRLPDGKVLVEQIVTNKTDPPETLDMRCHLLIRGRRRQTRNLDGLLSGQSRKAMFLIPDFDQLPAQDLWVRAEQKNGRRILNDLLNEQQVRTLLERETTPGERGASAP